MLKNGTQIIHLATGRAVGYAPSPHLDYFREHIPRKFGLEVVVGTHLAPEKFHLVHADLGTWPDFQAREDLAALLADQQIRLAYD